MADFANIKSVGLSLSPGVDYFLPVPLGVYALVFYPANGFLAAIDGSVTDYPHRAILFTHKLYQNFIRLLVCQNLTYLDVVHIPLLLETDSVPTTIAGTPTGFRITTSIPLATLATLQGCTPQVWVGTTPLLNSYACSVDLGTGICQAIASLGGGGPSPVTLYYESATGVYTALMTVANTAIALTP